MRFPHSSPICFLRRRALAGRSKGGFSLVELMVVIVILTILMLAALPVFVKSTAKSRQASRELVKGHLMRARSHAIATGSSTAVLFADYSSGNEIGGKMLGIGEVTWTVDPAKPDEGAYQVSKLLQRWEKLSGSVIVLNQTATASSRPTLIDETERVNVTYSGKRINAAFVVFSANGQIIFPQNKAIEITLGAGSLAGGTPKATEKIDNRASYDLLQVNRLTGRARLIENP